MSNEPPHGADSRELLINSALYKEFLAERREILCHKWIESEKAGYDMARPTAEMISPARFVCCAYGAQTLERGSVKIRRSHTAFRQRQRPRCSRRITCVPWTGRSRRERQYQLWREREMRWQPLSTVRQRHSCGGLQYHCADSLLHRLGAAPSAQSRRQASCASGSAQSVAALCLGRIGQICRQYSGRGSLCRRQTGRDRYL